MDLRPDEMNLLPSRLPELKDLAYYDSLPYKLKAPEAVLIVGSGMGADVQEALAHGATHVEAVEIDPLIIKLGKEKNARQPYADQRVHAVNDDARHFFNTTDKKFDLIIFGLLD